MLHERPALDPRVAAVIMAASGTIATVAVLMTEVYLRNGLMLGGDYPARMQYIARNPTVWMIGWVAWMAAGLSLVGVFLVLTDSFRNIPRWLVMFVIAFVSMGVACDLMGDVVHMSILSSLADRFASAPASAGHLVSDFALWDRVGVALTGAAANTAYGISGLLLIPGMLTEKWLPVRFIWCSVAVWLAVLLASVAMLGSPPVVEAAFGVALGLYIVWTMGMSSCYALRAHSHHSSGLPPVESTHAA